MEFFDWNMLGECAGAATAVGLLTQITKNVPGILKIPTQLWSYLLALATLMLALVFNGNFTVSGVVMAVFNAVVVSLTANGGYSALQRACQGEKKE